MIPFEEVYTAKDVKDAKGGSIRPHVLCPFSQYIVFYVSLIFSLQAQVSTFKLEVQSYALIVALNLEGEVRASSIAITFKDLNSLTLFDSRHCRRSILYCTVF